MTQQLLTLIAQIIGVFFDIAGAVMLIWTIVHLINSRHQARKPQPSPSKMYYASVGDKVWYAHLPGTAYEVGSPEYNAQVVGAIREPNERLEASGKRIPEKTALDIIQRTSKEDGQQ